MLVTALDLETSGLDPTTDRITEVGAVLWDVAERRPVNFLSYLVKDETGAEPLKPEITELTGITDSDLQLFGYTLKEAFSALDRFIQHSTAVLVHGGLSLDKALFERDYAKTIGPVPQLPWVDTQIDFAYPPQMKMRALKYLAADHKHFLEFAHRGLFDSVATIQIASHYDIAAAVEIGKYPIVKVRAGVDITTKDEAKTRGYYYDNTTRSWYKNLRSCFLDHEKAHCPFEVTVVT